MFEKIKTLVNKKSVSLLLCRTSNDFVCLLVTVVEYVCFVNVKDEYFSVNARDWRAHVETFRLSITFVVIGVEFCCVMTLEMISSVCDCGVLFCFNICSNISSVSGKRILVWR